MEERKEVREALLHYHNDPYNVSIDDRLACFERLKILTKNDEEQKSEAWKLKRSKIIGGSEIKRAAKVKSKDFLGLICEKAGLGSFTGNLFTMFGSIIEPTSRRFTELLFATTIYEFTSLPGSIPGTAYSPDGISVIDDHGRTFIILWEYKSPFVRCPTRVVPDEYRPQITSGLCHIRIADYGIFTNFAFRICALENFDDTLTWNTSLQPYNKKYHLMAKNVIGLGMIVFTHKEVGDYKPKLEKLVNYVDERSVEHTELEILLMKGEEDYGQIDDQWKLNALFKSIETEDIKIHHLEPYIYMNSLRELDHLKSMLDIPNDAEQLNAESELKAAHQSFLNNMDCLREKICPDETIMGVLPLKLIDLDLIRVTRNPDYMNYFREGLEVFNTLMPKVMALPLEERNKFIRQELGYPAVEINDENPDMMF